MKVLVLNGSPRAKKSNTLKVTDAFLKGLCDNAMHNVEIVDVAKSDINHCKGCFSCWTKTPGKCVFKDDMTDIINKYINADLVIWSFPLYFFSMPSKIKNCMDRLLPIMLPYIHSYEDGTCGHPLRYDIKEQKHLLISTAGFYSRANNFEGLLEQFRILYEKNGGYEKIICTEGELFSINALKKRADEYLAIVEQAGKEYSKDFQISNDTQKSLGELLFEPEKFCAMANASWDIAEGKENDREKTSSKALRFATQMAEVYVPSEYKKDLVLEFEFSDVNETYQFHIDREGCRLVTKDFAECDTKIQTSLKLWMDISNGKQSATDALYEHKYKVFGNFSVMYNLERMFGIAKDAKLVTSKKRLPNLLLLLLPYIAMWVSFPFGNFIGSVVTVGAIVVCALSYLFIKSTVYEHISLIGALAIVLLAIFDVANAVIVPIPYFMFGLIWIITVFCKAPLTAHYMLVFFGGKTAIHNKLYLRTNRITTTVWSIYYIIAGIVSCFAPQLGIGNLWGAVANAPVILLGIFTFLLVKLYVPAYAKK